MEVDNEDLSPLKAGPKKTGLNLPEVGGESAIRHTASDVYFHLASRPSKTSDNVFSALLPHLTAEECAALVRNSPATRKHKERIAALRKEIELQFPQFGFELSQGFNLLFYGYGSKRTLLNDFARLVCAKHGHIVIVNGFFPSFSLRELVESIEKIPGIASQPISLPSGIDGQVRRIYDYFLPPETRSRAKSSRRPLFLIVHNIESPGLRNSRAQACLSLLASNPRIHVVASIDNVYAPLMWTTHDILNRKHEYHETDQSLPSTRGFQWLWHPATTFEPYDIELSFRDLSVLPKSGGSGRTAGDDLAAPGRGGSGISETAAKQVLASVTQKAKRLFVVLGRQQLAAWVEQGGAGGNSVEDLHTLGMAHNLLSIKARDEFLATSDVGLRGLLQEFRDHGLVLSASVAGVPQEGRGAGDVLWIPLPKDILTRILEGLAI
ncbi:hypothetical protein BS47DRAFT_1291336 [Hydnum rufescens UP504]|uniref:Origin recognition complex subunit 2 n=1 Tax=Hydnum rufescens UP504 TaxID=1448309 RepID=A0A9P6B3V0_9AGAM|nr:hypothetical protein BS47DRAFT_1291336 [Hydnum rufescens UP504]